MGIISIEQADRLYWLGRYSERVYTTIRLYFNSFDELIDGTGDLYQNFCKMINQETRSIRYENIETICLLLNCTPNDLFTITED